MGIPDLFHSQGIKHLKQILLVAHRSEDLTGALIRGSLEQLKLEVGLGGSLFSHPYAPFQHVATRSWLTCTWQFTSTFGIQLDERTPCLPLRCQGDQFLMECFLHAGYSGTSLHQLNVCRLFLQAITLSDICTGDGCSISPLAWEGHRDPTRPSPYRWPNQPRPSSALWRVWQQALPKALHLSQRLLPRPLGPWFPDVALSWFYSPQEHCLYYL
jgi:hypothetical protein